MKKYLFFVMIVAFSLSCGSKKAGVYFDASSMPVQTVHEAKTMFTDRGELQMLLEQPVLHNYDDEDKTQISPRGIELSFYDKETHKQQVYLRADSAVNSQASKLMRFYKNVVIYDYRRNDTIRTETLYWDQNKRKIYSNTRTVQSSATMLVKGTGFDADEQMNNVEIRNPDFSF
ncbi:MAG: LPS export ABC transporter periplasmic protein LptC [Bacteroidales bacterium]|nr:LPS export ABC transporter periplasmic protein LptC [Bacteroidales bacterium]